MSSIVKFNTIINPKCLSIVHNNQTNMELKYSDDELLLETCLLSIQKINRNQNLSITCSFNEKSENNKSFLYKILIIEKELRMLTNRGITSPMNRLDNVYYIDLDISKDTIIFNKHKKCVSLDSLFINAIVKCLITINYLTVEDNSIKYSLQVKQILISNSL